MRSPVGDRPYPKAPARSVGLRRRSVTVLLPPFFILPRGTTIKYKLIYIYIYIYIYIGIFIKVVENLCRDTHEPLWPQPQRVGVLGLRLDMRRLPDSGCPP
jgi:hypothetical protein